MAVGLNTGVPWVMCKQDDAPDPVVKAQYPLPFSVSNCCPKLAQLATNIYIKCRLMHAMG